MIIIIVVVVVVVVVVERVDFDSLKEWLEQRRLCCALAPPSQRLRVIPPQLCSNDVRCCMNRLHQLSMAMQRYYYCCYY
jgi:hypothetical protein